MMVILMICNGCQPKQNAENKNALLGSWSIDKISWVSKDTSVTITPDQKGILLVTPSYYSISWSPVKVKRKAFENLSRPSDEEVLQGFKSIVFNAGSFQKKDGVFATKALIAKVPGFEGGEQFYRYRLFDNDSLELLLYDETYPSGLKPNWIGQWQTAFILKRL